MRALRVCLALLGAACIALAQPAEEDFRVPGQHPSLLLNPARLRLLRRERERQSTRWIQFQSLIESKAPLPEPGFAEALYFQVSGDKAAARSAIQWALAGGGDLRQLALVFDWCQPAMTDQESAKLATRLAQAILQPPAGAGADEARSRVFAAIALSDREPAASERELRRAVQEWWRGQIVPALAGGRDALPRADRYALFELLHAVRDNLGIDLRESARAYFSVLPSMDLLSYYPAPHSAGGNQYSIPASASRKMDTGAAEAARMADFAIVAYDTSALENQFVQGWLMRDSFVMRGPLGAPYEFLWANPYLPGLSYRHAPLAVHDEVLGQLFVRSSWDDDARWAGWFGGRLQASVGGKVSELVLTSPKLLDFDGTVVAVPADALAVTIGSSATRIFLVGLQPGRQYELRIEGHKRAERADPGGVVELQFTEGFRGAIRIREMPPHR
jgi:hypothetical protein